MTIYMFGTSPSPAAASRELATHRLSETRTDRCRCNRKELKENHVHTLNDIEQLAGIDVLDHLDRQVDVPVIGGPQAQGDLIVIPAPDLIPAATPVPKAGVPVIRGENGGNTHLLIGDGPICWDTGRDGAQTLGTLTVPDGSAAFLIHPEHGAAGIAPGTCVIRRQREQRDEIALVTD